MDYNMHALPDPFVLLLSGKGSTTSHLNVSICNYQEAAAWHSEISCAFISLFKIQTISIGYGTKWKMHLK